MKKIKNFFKNNVKVVAAFVIGILISCVSVYAATIIGAGEVSYTNNSQTSVQSALDDLYTKAAKCPNSPVKLGDYISLTPTKTSYTIKTSLTGYTSDQTINPSELTLWRVIDIHSDGSFDAVSEYTSSTDVYFAGTTGYANFVGALNTIAAQYQVPGKTIESRMMGYGGQTSIIGDTSAFDGTTNTAPSTTSTASPTTGTGEEYLGGVAGDTLYLKDYLLVGNVYKSNTSTYGSKGVKAYNVSATTTAARYWLASRGYYYYSSSTEFIFSGRSIYTNGDLDSGNLRQYSNSWSDISRNRRVRPILTLKSGLTVASGSGTKASPYAFN